jgi:hypothetical protein
VVALGTGNKQKKAQDLNLFGPLKQHLRGRRFHSEEEVEMAVRDWLRMQEPDFYRDGIVKLVP